MIIKNSIGYLIYKYITKLIILLLISQGIPFIINLLFFHTNLKSSIYIVNAAGICIICFILYSVKQMEIIEKEIRVKYLFKKTIEIILINNSYNIIYEKIFGFIGEYKIYNNKNEVIWKLREYEIEPKYRKDLQNHLIIKI